MYHQYRPNNLERLYEAQHYTYGYKVQLLLRALGLYMEVRKVAGCAKPQKGSFRPQNRFSPFSAHISMVLPIARQVYIAFGVYGQPHVLTLGYFILLSVY